MVGCLSRRLNISCRRLNIFKIVCPPSGDEGAQRSLSVVTGGRNSSVEPRNVLADDIISQEGPVMGVSQPTDDSKDCGCFAYLLWVS